MIRKFLLLFLLASHSGKAQPVIGGCQPIPYPCPVICAGGTLLLRVYQAANFPVGTEIQALISDASGSFVSGTQVVPVRAVSYDNGGNWLPGPLYFANNIYDFQVAIDIPASTPAGNNYSVRIQASTGYVSPDPFICGGTNSFTVTAYTPPLPQVAQNTQGTGRWFGHVYKWTPTIPGVLPASAIPAQDFFNPANYQGHVIYNPFSFDIDLFGNGYMPGTIHAGTSIDCGNTLYENFSIRMLRRENLTPGLYEFRISADDGIRLSIDGGATWLLSSWFEQNIGSSVRSTSGAFPNGVCINGPTDFVIEYFQRPQETRLTFSATQLTTFNNTSPQDQSVCSGANATFRATGPTGSNYQWQVSTDGGTTFTNIANAAPYSGVFSQNLQVTAVPGSFDGYIYRCVISGLCGTNPTSGAILNVGLQAQLTQQPVSQMICNGQHASFSAAGNGVTAWQWQVSADGGATFTDISNAGFYSGATASQLHLTNPPSSASGYIFRAKADGGCGSPLFSNPATLTIGQEAVITQHPHDQVLCDGQALSFPTTATGDGLTYQWQFSTDGGTTWNPVPASAPWSGGTSPVLTITGAPQTFVGYHVRVVVTGCNGTPLYGNMAAINGVQGITINPQPLSATVCEGQPVHFDLGTSAATNYQWQVNSGTGYTNVVNGGIYSGAQSPSLSISAATAASNGWTFRCVVSGTCSGSIQSDVVTLTVNPLTVITQQAVPQVICPGQDAHFSINATGNGLSYQWQVSTDGGVTYTNLNETPPYSGVTSGSLNISLPPTSMNGYRFRCEVNGVCGTNQQSTPALLTVTSLPEFISLPGNQTVCAGQPVNFTGESGSNSVYQWQSSSDGGITFGDLSNGGPYSGVDSKVLTIDPAGLPMNGMHFRLSATACNSTISCPSVLLEVLPLPEFLSVVPPASICPGEDAKMSVAGANVTGYQWQVNTSGTWTDIVNNDIFNGANQASLTIENVPASLQHARFRCLLEGSCEPPVFSAEIPLPLKGIPDLISQPASQAVCSGEAMNFGVQATGDSITYQWQVKMPDGSYENIEDADHFKGSTQAVLRVPGNNELNGTVIRCIVEGCGVRVETDSALITVHQNNPVYIPNSFTPDGDLVNPVFKIYTEGNPLIDAYIFNRWGAEIFHWTSSDGGWDGSCNGTLVPDGVYVYHITITTACQKKTVVGRINLYR